MKFRSILFAALYMCLAISLQAQGVRSPEVQPDRKVTFRYRAPNAKEVFLSREGAGRVAMQKDDRGIWSFTTEPLAPDYYGYTIIVDGVGVIDPANPLMKPNLLNTQSMVYVPGDGAMSWDLRDVPRGVVHRHPYRSKVVGDNRELFVYTPPGYDAKAGKTYPILYLLHGFSDDASGWTAVGRAHTILDNLIADGKCKPMIVVMPLGYGAPEVVMPGGGPRPANLWETNLLKFKEALLDEALPMVEGQYRVDKRREMRAIAGLSMGGSESLLTGLNALDRFAYVASFSAGGLPGDYAAKFPGLDDKANARLKLLWIGCGTEDGLIGQNRSFQTWLDKAGIKHTKVETPGGHTWAVWRKYLTDVVPLLFRN